MSHRQYVRSPRPAECKSRQQQNYPCRRKTFPTIPQPHPQPHLCLRSHKHCSLESTDILYIPTCSLCVCVCLVCVCGERATKPDGCLVWFRLEPSVISAAEVVSCHALATLPNHLKHLNSTLIGLSLQLVCPDSGGEVEVGAQCNYCASVGFASLELLLQLFSIVFNCIVVH